MSIRLQQFIGQWQADRSGEPAAGEVEIVNGLFDSDGAGRNVAAGDVGDQSGGVGLNRRDVSGGAGEGGFSRGHRTQGEDSAQELPFGVKRVADEEVVHAVDGAGVSEEHVRLVEGLEGAGIAGQAGARLRVAGRISGGSDSDLCVVGVNRRQRLEDGVLPVACGTSRVWQD